VKKAFATSAVLLILAFSGVSNAQANSLVGTSPISGSTVSVSPTSVTVTGQVLLLADAIDANVISVIDPNGVRVDDGTITVVEMSATVGVKPLTDSGRYTVSYSLLSDGDAPLEGSFTFNYSAPSSIAPTEPSPSPSQSQTPASSSWGTNFFVITMLVLSAAVTVGLSLYARKLFTNR